MKNNGKNKISNIMLNLSVAAVLVATGFFVGNVLTATPTSAAGTSVGYVNIEELLDMHPAKDNVLDRLAEYEEKEIQKLEPYSKEDMTSEEKKESLEMSIEIRDKIKAKRKEMIEPLYADIMEKARDVGREAGVEVVIDSVVILYGGIDLTPAVYNKLDSNL